MSTLLQDWAGYQSNTPSTTGLAGVFIKVTEGTTYVNPRWKAQRDHARANGLVVGYYHFVNAADINAQADFFLKTLGTSLKIGEMLSLDWESTGCSGAEKDTWIKRVQAKQPDHRTGLYCNLDYWKNRDTTSFAGDFLWIADPSAPVGKPRIQADWMFHQYSSAGGVDRDIANPLHIKDKAALLAWAEKSVTPPPVTPPKETHVALTETDGRLAAKELLDYDDVPASRVLPNEDYATNPTWTVRYALQAAVEGARAAQASADRANAKLDTLAVGGVDLDALAAKVADLLAARLQG